jgi:putative MATE family efflux protein
MNRNPETINLTDMTLNRAIFSMAVPAAGSMMVQSLYHLVDTFWVGKLGAVPLAAVSATAFWIWMMFSLGDIAGVAANALVARAVGARRDDLIADNIRDCVMTSLAVSVILMALLLPSMGTLFRVLDLAPDVVAQATEYVWPWLLFLPVVLLMVPVASIFRAVGDARTPLKLQALMVVLNAVLDPIFIFGYGPIPAMGLAGAAWVTVGNQSLFILLGILILRKRGLWFTPNRRTLAGITRSGIARVFRIGLPIALNGSLFSLSYVGLTWVIAQFGSSAVAAIGMGHRMEAFPWFVSYGFSVAAASLVGQYLGAGQPEQAERAVWKSGAVAFGGVLLFFVVMMLAVKPVVRWFIDDPAVVAQSAAYLRIVAACWLFGVFEVVLEGGFSGAGNTMPPLVVGVPFTMMRIPLAYLLAISLGMGVSGVWWAIGLSMVIKGILMIVWFRRGRWKMATVG